jgi:dipeptidyl aminopeptidase/acylaminoacyl peptidase
MDSDLLLVERGGTVRNLTEHEGEQWIYDAGFSHDEAGVWMLSNLEREFVALIYQDVESGDRRIVFEAEWDVEQFALSPDGNSIALSINENGVSRAVLISTSDQGEAVEIETPRGVIDGFSWSPDSGSVAFGFSTIEQPSIVMVATVTGDVRTVAQGDDVEAPTTIAPESIWFTSWDGREIPGYFFKPEGDGPFPALVEIHGGPESQRRLDYDTNGPALQYITSLGIAVLALNVRGSKGYGKSYCHLDDKGKRLDALKDVAHAANWLQARDDIVGSRIAVYGISYGGFMTLSSLVRYPELWAAGVEMVGMANLATFLERTGPWRRKHREGEYGELATERDMLERVSPLPLVDNISAPLMVFHGRQDARVPLYESEQIVEAVKKRGLDVVLRVYDDEGHIFSKRPNIIDAFGLIGEFLTRHLEPGSK